jgi:hypothetical protein
MLARNAIKDSKISRASDNTPKFMGATDSNAQFVTRNLLMPTI